MEAFFTYLLKACMWTALFAAAYRLFFRGATFYRFNRRFLVAALVFSLLLPLVQFRYTKVVYVPGNWFPAASDVTAAPYAQSPDWPTVLLCIYAAGAALALGCTVYRLCKVWGVIRRAGYTRYDGYRLVEVEPRTAPFSFIDFIFLNLRSRTPAESGIIIAHELSHIRSRHWVDLMLGKAIQTMLWFNPFVRLLVGDMRRNHEYMADRAVIEQGNSPALYKAVLINNSLGGAAFSLGHSLSCRNNLKRYQMMNKSKSNGARRWLLLTILPVAAALFTAFAQPEYKIVETPQPTGSAPGTAALHGHAVEPLSVSDTVRTNVTVICSTPLYLVNGIEVSKKVVDEIDMNKVVSVTILKDSTAMAIYGQKAKSGVVVIETADAPKKDDSRIVSITIPPAAGQAATGPEIVVVGAYKPDGSETVAVGTTDAEPVQIVTAPMKSVAATSITSEIFVMGAPSDDNPNTRIKVVDESGAAPLVIIDGAESDIVSLTALDTNTIESVTVLKDKTARKIYGKRGANGVIIVELK